jgi:hypothetical protein
MEKNSFNRRYRGYTIMKKYLIIGLEGSGTRMVAQYLAFQLNLTKEFDDWNGKNEISNTKYKVIHRSLPHGPRPKVQSPTQFISPKEFGTPKELAVIICIRDININFLTSRPTHNKGSAMLTLNNIAKGIKCIYEVIYSEYKTYLFSYEMAFALQHYYFWQLNKFLDIPITKKFKFKITNENAKYFNLPNDITLEMLKETTETLLQGTIHEEVINE